MDNLLAVQAWVRRWMPDVLALQECPSSEALAELDVEYAFVGAAAAHVGYVHLYVRRGLSFGAEALADGLPGVMARGVVDGVDCEVVACHLAPHASASAVEERGRQVESLLAKVTAPARIFMGDLNVREDEANDLCDKNGLNTD